MKRVVSLIVLAFGAGLLFGRGPVFAQAMNLGPAGMRPQGQEQGQGQAQVQQQQAQQRRQKQQDCARQAREQGLRGGDLNRFMQTCTGG